jgi:hypothetical protein
MELVAGGVGRGSPPQSPLSPMSRLTADLDALSLDRGGDEASTVPRDAWTRSLLARGRLIFAIFRSSVLTKFTHCRSVLKKHKEFDFKFCTVFVTVVSSVPDQDQ